MCLGRIKVKCSKKKGNLPQWKVLLLLCVIGALRFGVFVVV